jgi:threonine/homoserine/homoserine lactone efflux protein
MNISAEFLVTALVVVLVPGTGVIYTVSAGLFQGRRASAFAAVGCTLGIVPHLIASGLGISALMQMSAEVFQLLKLLGVLYLLYLAWAMWRSTGALSVVESDRSSQARTIVTRGILINLLNPKLTLFFFAFMPQFLTSGSAIAAPMLLLSGVFMGLTLVVFVIYGLVASKLRDRVISSPNVVEWLQRGFAGAFALLAARLAFQQR